MQGRWSKKTWQVDESQGNIRLALELLPPRLQIVLGVPESNNRQLVSDGRIVYLARSFYLESPNTGKVSNTVKRAP